MDTVKNMYVSGNRDRMDLQRIAANYQGGLTKWSIYRHMLIYQTELSPNRKNYEFIVKETNQQGQLPSEILLNINDSFHMTHWSLGVMKQAPTATPALTVANSDIWFNADPLIFDGVAVAGVTEAQSVTSVWNAKLTLKTNQVDRIKPFSCNRLRFSPAYPTRDDPTGNQLNSQYGPTIEEQGFFYIGNPIQGLNGSEDNRLILNLPDDALIDNINGDTDAGGAAGNGNTNLLTIRLYGFIVIQGSQSLYKSNYLIG